MLTRVAAVSIGAGAALGGLFVGMLALSIAPGRAALASVDTAHSRTEVFLAGICRDVASIVPGCGVVALAVLVLGVALHRRSSHAGARFLFTVFPVGVGVLCPFLWLVSSSAEEFRIQRGIDPTWFDLRIALTDPDFVSSSLRVFLYQRHAVPSAIALLVLACLFVAFRRFSSRFVLVPAVDPRVAIVGFGIAVALADGAALLPIDPHARLFRTLSDRSAVGQPFTTLFEPFGARPANVQLGLASILSHARIQSENIAAGAALLGLPFPQTSASGTCTPHPFARSFSFDGPEGLPTRTARATPLLAALESLSSALFDGRTESPVVLQVLLEGVRADDVHALNPNAAPEVAPFLNHLYDDATGRVGSVGGVLGARRMFQAGVRTAQALSAVTCGLGTLPFGIALGRDLGPLPLRCLPDVLVDAGFYASFYYGARVSFDNMEGFLNLHGFSHIVGQWQLPRDLPAVYWGVTDQSLFDAVLSEARGWSAAPQYSLVMTVSNHMPFAEPPDLPASVRARVEVGLAKTRNLVQHDDLPRLLTLSYTDDAFARFTGVLSASSLGKRTLIVAVGDHSTSDHFVWPPGDGSRADTDEAKSRIPFVVILPEAFVGATSNPVLTRDALHRADVELNRTVLSENDVPALLLALLSRSPHLSRLPSASRWHTLGGALTSPWFSGPGGFSGSGGTDIALLGINSASVLFSLDVDGHRSAPLVEAGPLDTADALYTACPPLQPVRSLLSSFLNGYASACRSPSVARATH